MLESLRLSTILPASPKDIYEAWLNSDRHTRVTGGGATIDPKVGGRFEAWDGYIEGSTLELEPHRRIVQSWRTTEFPRGHEDSRVEILLEPFEGGTKLTLVHTRIPEGQGERYEHGWSEFYFDPMKAFYSKVEEEEGEDEGL